MAWAELLGRANSNVRKIGYRGSYADGSWGVGSDIDLVIVLESTSRDFFERGRDYDATNLPVPADVVVYTVEEESRRGKDLKGTVWVYRR